MDPARKAKLLKWSFLAENDVDSFKFAEKSGFQLLETYFGNAICKKLTLKTKKYIVVAFLIETYQVCCDNKLNHDKMFTAFAINIDALQYFENETRLPARDLWRYYKELMYMHSFDDSPSGEEIFQPNECLALLKHFHTTFMKNLPLIHQEVHPPYKLQMKMKFIN